MSRTSLLNRFSNHWKSFQSLETFDRVFSNHWKILSAFFQSLESAFRSSKRVLEGGALRRRLSDAVSQSSTLHDSPYGLNCERRKLVVNAVRRVGVLGGAVFLLVCSAQAEDLHGLAFDGRVYVVVTNASDLRLDGNYTVEMWLKPAAGLGHVGLLNKGTNWTGGAKCLAMGRYRPEFDLCNVVHSGGVGGENKFLPSGQWSHAAWVVRLLGGRNQREYRMYVNGAENGVFTNVTREDWGVIELGRYANCCDCFVGEMCDVRYWNISRSQDEIRDYMLKPPVGNTNLIAHWLYDQGSGVEVVDSAGDYDGVIMDGGTGSNLWRSVAAVPGVVSPRMKGLWVGQAAVSKVSRLPMSSAQTNDWDYAPVDTAQKFSMRLIVHVDENGGMRLLPEVYLAASEKWVTVTNYSGVGMTNESNGSVVSNKVWEYGAYSAAAKVPGTMQQVQRISATAYPLSVGPVVLFGETNCYAGNVEVLYDDALNPFVHVYHPDHDNKDADGHALGEGLESWTLRRRVSLDFMDENPVMRNDPHWKVDRWGGTYRERIQGVSRFDVYVEGAFGLEKVSDAGVLD